MSCFPPSDLAYVNFKWFQEPKAEEEEEVDRFSQKVDTFPNDHPRRESLLPLHLSPPPNSLFPALPTIDDVEHIHAGGCCFEESGFENSTAKGLPELFQYVEPAYLHLNSYPDITVPPEHVFGALTPPWSTASLDAYSISPSSSPNYPPTPLPPSMSTPPLSSKRKYNQVDERIVPSPVVPSSPTPTSIISTLEPHSRSRKGKDKSTCVQPSRPPSPSPSTSAESSPTVANRPKRRIPARFYGADEAMDTSADVPASTCSTSEFVDPPPAKRARRADPAPSPAFDDLDLDFDVESEVEQDFGEDSDADSEYESSPNSCKTLRKTKTRSKASRMLQSKRWKHPQVKPSLRWRKVQDIRGKFVCPYQHPFGGDPCLKRYSRIGDLERHLFDSDHNTEEYNLVHPSPSDVDDEPVRPLPLEKAVCLLFGVALTIRKAGEYDDDSSPTPKSKAKGKGRARTSLVVTREEKEQAAAFSTRFAHLNLLSAFLPPTTSTSAKFKRKGKLAPVSLPNTPLSEPEDLTLDILRTDFPIFLEAVNRLSSGGTPCSLCGTLFARKDAAKRHERSCLYKKRKFVFPSCVEHVRS